MQTASRSNQPFYHNTVFGQTNRQTDRQTDGLGKSSVPWALSLTTLIESDALKIRFGEIWSHFSCKMNFSLAWFFLRRRARFIFSTASRLKFGYSQVYTQVVPDKIQEGCKMVVCVCVCACVCMWNKVVQWMSFIHLVWKRYWFHAYIFVRHDFL